jgi:hypothetical protein
MKATEVRPGMKGIAWTVFSGTEPEPVPVEIIGRWENALGPKKDVILGKMGGKAVRTNVAGGMSGSPVYIDGKLLGAVALRISVFSPDAICGITPIEDMLEINNVDKSIPAAARTPDKLKTKAEASVPLDGDMLSRVLAAGASPKLADESPVMVPIETPVMLSGFNPGVFEDFGPMFERLGMVAVQGGASSKLDSAKPAAGWQKALQPGDPIAGVLVSGDMSITGLGTVTYNDGKRVLGFGHPFFNLGPVDMPMAAGNILFTLASSYQPNKFGTATEIVGALHQDRASGIMGVLGEAARTVPVSVKVRSFNDDNSLRSEKDYHFDVFVHQKWTPSLMMLTLYNTISNSNDYGEECTYRVSGRVQFADNEQMQVSTMEAPSDVAVAPAPIALAGWWADKFNQLFSNSVKMPDLSRVDATIDLLPDRRTAGIENAWMPSDEVQAGEQVPVKVFIRPYRGPRIEKTFTFKVPAGLAPGNYSLLLSDASALNRMQRTAGQMNRYLDVPQIISLINQERPNNKLYVSLLEPRPTVYYDDKTLPSLPASVLNVMQTGRSSNRVFAASAQTAQEQAAIPFDYVINGSYTLRFTVR